MSDIQYVHGYSARAAEPGGTFCYTFFRGTGTRS